jgi:glycosyltransferase involved in cell wall biosynthesis
VIYFDVTKSSRRAPRSGLSRVSARLREGLGSAAVPVAWHARSRGFRLADGGSPVDWRAADWLLTSELFDEAERPGFQEFIQRRPARLAAVYHDAIPLKLPHVTWPQSVARHPGYLSALAGFDRVLAISEASADELRGTIALGADFMGDPRRVLSGPPSPALLCVGILEPRKNQAFLLEVCESLWREGLKFDLHVAGRVNPHFGAPIVAGIAALRRVGRPVTHHLKADDAALRRLYALARATVFPSLAEGCGLPLLESLWMGVPCLCSDLPPLRENADPGGCLPVPTDDARAWAAALRRVLTDDAAWLALAAAAGTRPLPTWAETAEQVRAAL